MGVVTVERALADTRRAFDGVAPTYHDSNERNGILSAMRVRALATLAEHTTCGSHILDLGCGPGTDEVLLAERGYRVTAVDWSPAMVDEARRRVAKAGIGAHVDVHQLGIHELGQLAPDLFDAAYSNFGALNCVADPLAAAQAIADRLRHGGVLVASVIGRVCPWELALYGLRGQWARATIRLARRPVGVPLEGHTVWTRYFSAHEFARVFKRAGFELVALRALGLFAPPPYLEGPASRHPRLIGRLLRLDDKFGDWPLIRNWGDHFLIVLRRA
ncbi:MAG TPA: methyltransferase domain-containing protein [Vicinamibacterales bacterium]